MHNIIEGKSATIKMEEETNSTVGFTPKQLATGDTRYILLTKTASILFIFTPEQQPYRF
jgi:hypothetical protein